MKIYTSLLLLLSITVVIADLELYNAWKYRIEVSVLDYLKNTNEAQATVSSAPLWLLLFLFIGLLLSSYFFYQYLFKKVDGIVSFKFKNFIVAIGAAIFMILPMRGGVGIAPLNPGAVYFSNQPFANHNAINPIWNFLYTAINKKVNKNPFIFMDAEVAKENFDKMMLPPESIDKKWIAKKNTNVIIVIWESFTSKVVDKTHDDIVITPGFNAWKKRGIYFSNAYASGDRTEKGLAAVLSGYPAQPITSILKETTKASSLPVISKVFKSAGYSTSFYYGGDLEFANMKAYLQNALFDNLISKNGFNANQLNSKWGAHDHDVFNKYLGSKLKIKQPFFDVIMTLTSHEPYETPIKKVIAKNDETSKFLNSINYTDQSLDNFLTSASKLSWWKNTLIIVVADHGHRLPNTGNRIDDFHIPILWTGGALDTNFVVTNIVSQVDIAKTLLDQLELPSKEFKFSKSLGPSNNWAYFAFNNGFGFVDGHCQLIYDNQARKIVQSSHEVCNQVLLKGQSFLQIHFDNYINAGKFNYKK